MTCQHIQITGDGTGIPITAVMLRVEDAAVEKAYSAKKYVDWMEGGKHT